MTSRTVYRLRHTAILSVPFIIGISIAGSSAFAQFTAQNTITGDADGAVASFSSSTAVGTDAMATGSDSTALGRSASADGSESTALGRSASADANFSTALGELATASGESSTSVGQLSTASGTDAIAMGRFASASGEQSTSIGTQSVASFDGATALGFSSSATNFSATAVGQAASASGANGVAIGRSSVASSGNSTALGAFAQATMGESTAIGSNAFAFHQLSTAIGAQAATTRDFQVMVGTAFQTYTLPGITSATSAAAQTGPVELVTSDAGGNLATMAPADLGIATVGDIDALKGDVGRNTEGIAMAMALTGIPNVLPTDATYAISTNWGTFGGENAMAIGGTAALTHNIFISGGGAFGTGANKHNTGGGRAGVTYTW